MRNDYLSGVSKVCLEFELMHLIRMIILPLFGHREVVDVDRNCPLRGVQQTKKMVSKLIHFNLFAEIAT